MGLVVAILFWLFALVGCFGVVTLFLPGLLHVCLGVQDLKKKVGLLSSLQLLTSSS